MDRLALFLIATFAFPCLLPADSIRDVSGVAVTWRGRGIDMNGTLYAETLVHVRFADIFGSLANPVSALAPWGEDRNSLTLGDAVVGSRNWLSFEQLAEMPPTQSSAVSWIVSPDQLAGPAQNAATHVRHTAWGPNRLFRW